MKLEKFTSYDEYVQVQTHTNKRKIDCVWVTSVEVLSFISMHGFNRCSVLVGLP